MKDKTNISSVFSSHLFWDVDLKKLSVKKDMALIIPRALLSVTDKSFNQEISKLETLYTQSEILETLKNTKERISNKLCELVAKKYNVEPFFRYKA